MKIRYSLAGIGVFMATIGCAEDDGAPASAPADSEGSGASPSDTGAPPESPGTPISISDGWASSEALEISGPFFAFPDLGGSVIVPVDASPTGHCVAGTAAQVIDGNYDMAFGATLGMNLNQRSSEVAASGYDARSHGVTGFGFEVRGNTGRALRYSVKVQGSPDEYCINTVPSCSDGCVVQYSFLEMARNCWDPGGDFPDASNVTSLEWRITTNTSGPVDFDFCIERLSALTE